ncbi:MAG: hypothetical protein ACJ8F7_07495 [Gemmataceae bacterium]
MKHLLTLALAALPCPALACTLCGGDLNSKATMRQEATQAKVIVVGKLTNARLNPNSPDGSGLTELQVERVLKPHAILKGVSQITIPRYLPFDEKSPKFLLMADVVQGKLDITAGRFVKDERVFDYLTAVQKLDEAGRAKMLQFYFEHLDSPVPEIAQDAYIEFAKATDAEVGQFAHTLKPDRLRKLLENPETQAAQLRLFAFLLGGCGQAQDADLLLRLLQTDSERTHNALGGLLAGYIVLRPTEGWKRAADIVADPKRQFLDHYAVLSTLRFFRGWKPNENGEVIRYVLKLAVADGSLADVAVEDLRRWGWWELTDAVVSAFSLKSHDAPIVRRAIARYALSCPQEKAKQFIVDLKKKDPALVKDAAESLEEEK